MGSHSMIDFGKVAVMMGGSSSERDISLESGQAVLAALKRKKILASIVDPQSNLIGQLQRGNFERAFIMLHGRGGEDGLIQGVLETLRLPYTGSGVLGASLSMDKCRSKRIWQSHQLPTPIFVELHEHGQPDWDFIVEYLGLPFVIKPVREGSSYGISKVNQFGDIEKAWQQACQYDCNVIAESWITGREYTVSILGDQILPMILLETPREFYDYEAKYVVDTTQYHCPCGLSTDMEKEFGSLAFKAFKVLDASGWGRVDLLVGDDGSPWLIEVNTVPGMTSHSLVPMAAKRKGISFDDLVMKILATSLRNSDSIVTGKIVDEQYQYE